MLYFAFFVFFLRTSSVGLEGVPWQISFFCSLFPFEQTIRGIGHRTSILSFLTSSFSMTILLYGSVEVLVQIYFTSRLMMFLCFVLVSLGVD